MFWHLCTLGAVASGALLTARGQPILGDSKHSPKSTLFKFKPIKPGINISLPSSPRARYWTTSDQGPQPLKLLKPSNRKPAQFSCLVSFVPSHDNHNNGFCPSFLFLLSASQQTLCMTLPVWPCVTSCVSGKNFYPSFPCLHVLPCLIKTNPEYILKQLVTVPWLECIETDAQNVISNYLVCEWIASKVEMLPTALFYKWHRTNLQCGFFYHSINASNLIPDFLKEGLK